jgi:hypothetical protein
MATMILLPDGTGISSANWVAVGEGTRHECLDDDNDNTSYVKSSTNLVHMIIEYANPSVEEADIDTIDSVRFLSSGKSIHRTNPSRVQIEYDTSGVSAYDEIVAYDAHRTNYESISGTSRTTSDGTDAWTYANLEALELKCTKVQAQEVYLSYLALEVTYTKAVSADNATFFGANF